MVTRIIDGNNANRLMLLEVEDGGAANCKEPPEGEISPETRGFAVPIRGPLEILGKQHPANIANRMVCRR